MRQRSLPAAEELISAFAPLSHPFVTLGDPEQPVRFEPGFFRLDESPNQFRGQCRESGWISLRLSWKAIESLVVLFGVQFHFNARRLNLHFVRPLPSATFCTYISFPSVACTDVTYAARVILVRYSAAFTHPAVHNVGGARHFRVILHCFRGMT